eukprot:g2306.t1
MHSAPRMLQRCRSVLRSCPSPRGWVLAGRRFFSDEEVPGHIGQHPRFFDFKASMLQTKQEFCTSCIRLFAKR